MNVELDFETLKKRLIKHKGFGNPMGDFWFIGMEEGGGGTVEELRCRAELDEVADLHCLEHIPPGMTIAQNATFAWKLMSMIVLRMKGNPKWQDKDVIHAYKTEHLGCLWGETFLAEVLPIPKPNLQSWPDEYKVLWGSYQDYRACVLDMRIQMLAQQIRDYQPRWIFFYGKQYWDYHRSLFDNKVQIPSNKLYYITQTERSCLVFTHAYVRYLWGTNAARVDEIVRELHR